jgi:hypothetical protein
VYPQVEDRENGLQLWGVAENTLKKQPWIADKVGLGVGHVAITRHRKRISLL